MKLRVFNGLIAALWLAFTLPLQASAHDFGPEQEFSKTISREFSTTANGTTAIFNRNGKVNINTWEKNVVKIDITIVVNASSEKNAQETFNRINVNFANTNGYVKAETVISEKNGGGWGMKGDDFRINYEVYMPAGNQLDLKHKYGNAYIGDMKGKLNVELKYGDLRAENIRNDVYLVLGYGKAGINSANNLSGQISYGGLVMNSVGNVQLDTKYSEFSIDKARQVRITSMYDEFRFGDMEELRLQTKYSEVKIGAIASLYMTAQYTDLNVDRMLKNLDADFKYGDIEIGAIAHEAQSLNITGAYTDVELRTDPNPNLRFEVSGSYTDISLPSNAVIKNRSENGSKESAAGYIGSEGGCTLKATLSYGDFKLR